MNSNILKLSKFGLFSGFMFFLGLILVRILYPVGDEPDFFARRYSVLYDDHLWFSPYFLWHDFLINLDSHDCNPTASAFSLWATIDRGTCTDSLYNIVVRISLTIFIVLPFIFISIFPRVAFFLKIGGKDALVNIKAISISLLFPGVLYHISALAEEQLVLFLGLMSFLFLNSISLIVLIFFLIFLIDVGNSFIFLFFYFLFFGFKYANLNKISKNKILFSFIFLFPLVVAYNIDIAYIFSSLSSVDNFSSKASSIESSYYNSDRIDKYPLYLRPIITFMSSVLTLPSGVKNIFGIFVLGVAFVYLLKKAFFISKENTHFLSVAIVTILTFIFLLPTYSNAKYYIWLVPFFIKPFLSVVSDKKILVFLLLVNFSNFIVLYLYGL